MFLKHILQLILKKKKEKKKKGKRRVLLVAKIWTQLMILEDLIQLVVVEQPLLELIPKLLLSLLEDKLLSHLNKK